MATLQQWGAASRGNGSDRRPRCPRRRSIGGTHCLPDTRPGQVACAHERMRADAGNPRIALNDNGRKLSLVADDLRRRMPDPIWRR